MKKVRLAVGSAMAAAGLMAVPVAAAHAAGTEGKTTHGDALGALQPNAACGVANSTEAFSPNLGFYAHIAFDGECVHYQGAVLTHAQTGLTERVRFYTSGRLTKTYKNAGLIKSGHTLFASYPNLDATMVCQALVANGTSTVKYGQECEYTSG